MYIKCLLHKKDIKDGSCNTTTTITTAILAIILIFTAPYLLNMLFVKSLELPPTENLL